MNKTLYILTAAMLGCSVQAKVDLTTLPVRDDVQLTIYNEEDLTLVREKRRITLKEGENHLQFSWANTLIDPTSLELEPVTHPDKIDISELVYPPRVSQLGRWTIHSEVSGPVDFELTYFTSGLKWNAFYEATLGPDEQSMQLKSFVRVDNGSGEDYENAQTRLVVGEINLIEHIAKLSSIPAYQPMEKLNFNVPPPILAGRPVSLGFSVEEDASKAEPLPKEIVKQALSEYQLYTIEGRETILNGWGKRLPSFDVQEIGITNLYKFDVLRWGNRTMRFLSFANTEACKLGKTPLPNGKVRVFKRVGEVSDLGDKLGYVGESDIKYIPVGEKADLEMGPATKVLVEPKLMKIRYVNLQFDEKGNLSGCDEISKWSIAVTNSKNIPVEVEVSRWSGATFLKLFNDAKLKNTLSARFDPEFNDWQIKTDTPYEKYDASQFRFVMKLEPQSRKTIEYELTRKMMSDD